MSRTSVALACCFGLGCIGEFPAADFTFPCQSDQDCIPGFECGGGQCVPAGTDVTGST